MLESKTYDSLFSVDNEEQVTDLLFTVYSANPRYLENAIKYTGIQYTYRNDLDKLAAHVLCLLQEDRAAGEWDDPYCNYLSQFLLARGRVVGIRKASAASFHPKIVLMRYTRNYPGNTDKSEWLRLLVGSKNLTGESMRETVISLEGEITQNINKKNDGLIELLKSVSGDALTEKFCTALSCCDFAPSLRKWCGDEKTDYSILAGGIKNQETLRDRFLMDLKDAQDCAILSPFISPVFLRDMMKQYYGNTPLLVANESDYVEEMQIALDGVRRAHSWKDFYLHALRRLPASVSFEIRDDEEVKSGKDLSVFLHAKMYVLTNKDNESVIYIGSANFSENGFARNQEVLLRITANGNFTGVVRERFAGLSLSRENLEMITCKTIHTSQEDFRESESLPIITPADAEVIAEQIRERYAKASEREALVDFFGMLFGKPVDEEPVRFALRELVNADNLKEYADRIEIMIGLDTEFGRFGAVTEREEIKELSAALKVWAQQKEGTENGSQSVSTGRH